MQTPRSSHCPPAICLYPWPADIKSLCSIKAKGTPMQLRRFIFKNNFAPGHQSGKKKIEWWKTAVIGLLIIAAVLLLASCILSSASTTKSSQENNQTKQPSSINYDLISSKEDYSKIKLMMLPMAQVYCSIHSCIVRCSLIPAASNPGIVAAVFVDSDYESHCADNVLVEELIFENCRFTGNALSSGWFPAKLQLRKLTFRGCSLTVINADAFNAESFEVLSSLALIDNGIRVFQKSVFDALANLGELVIMNNAIQHADADLLVGTANSLRIVQIDNAIYNENVLINITGQSPLSKVVILSLKGNLITNLSANVFKGVPNVQSIYLMNSAISSIEAHAFDPFSGSIRQLFLSHNAISSLPNNVFESILKVNPNFKVTLANNDWNCNCELEWLKNLTNTHLILNDEPRCAKPEWNVALSFSEATFCRVDNSNETGFATNTNSNTDLSYGTDTTEPINTGDDVTPVDDGLITLMCAVDEGTSGVSNRKLLAIREFKFRRRHPAFTVQEKENGSIYVSLITTPLAYTLIWFGNDVTDPSFQLESVNCITNVKKSLYLNKLRPGAVYTICLLNMFGDLISPFNCISIKKRENYEDSLWLANEDKTIIFSGVIACMIFICMVSVLGSYYVVRKNPKLLKGSKRIIMVRHRTADAIVLPEGIRLESTSKDPTLPKAESSMRRSSTNKDYITPISKRRLLARKSSVISGTSSNSSANSYVSGIEPTSIQLMSWRIKRIRNNLSCRDSTEYDDAPPPLPPPRNKSIPSLSLDVDEREISNDKRPVSIFTSGDDQEVIVTNEVNNEQRL